MKVLFISNIPSPNKIDFLNELGKLCELTATFELSKATDRNSAWTADKFRYFEAVQLKGIRFRSDQALCLDIVKYLRKKYDHIIVAGYSTPTGMFAIRYLKSHRIPFWISVDGGIISDESKIKHWYKKKLIGAASYWFSSGSTVDDYLEYYGADKNKIVRVPFTSLRKNDIQAEPCSRGDKEKIRNLLQIDPQKPVILSVGQFIYRKGFDVLLKAMNKCSRTYQLLIIGDEPTEEYMQLKKKYKLDNVIFCGFVGKEKLKQYYKAADLFVLPTREDIWGLVINEAMAMGLPVITTDQCVAGLELVKDNINGYIVPSENENELAECIERIMTSEEDRIRMGMESLHMIKTYTVENMALMYEDGMNNVTRSE